MVQPRKWFNMVRIIGFIFMFVQMKMKPGNFDYLEKFESISKVQIYSILK